MRRKPSHFSDDLAHQGRPRPQVQGRGDDLPLSRELLARMVRWFPVVAFGLLTTVPSRGALVINEVVYDPVGTDHGREWIELYNSGSWPAPLEGVRIEFGNGSAPDQWSVVWTGGSADWIEPRGWFVVGDSTLSNAPAILELQNGPDGVRVAREGLVLDGVGWGALEYGEYFEGRPAEEVRGAGSLARREDGIDTDDNERDFSAALASPGRANRPEVNLALEVAATARLLPVPALAEVQVPVPVRFHNRGRAAIALSAANLWIGGNRENPPPATLAAGGVYSVQFWSTVPPVPGVARVGVHASLVSDENPDDDRDTLQVSIGMSPLSLAEIHPRPRVDGEWIELLTHSELSTRGWTLEDAAGTTLSLADTILTPGIRIIVSELRAPGSLSWTGSWPALNDRASDAGIADSLFLRDRDSVVRDWVAYGEAEKGRSWVRLDPGAFGMGAWRADPTDGGTPGSAAGESNTIREYGDGVVSPGLSLRRDPDGVWIRVMAPSAPLDYQIRILDLTGHAVWSERGRVGFRGEARCRWNGRGPSGGPVAQGLYFVETERVWPEGRDRSHHPVVVGR